jgi:hypothetical protein
VTSYFQSEIKVEAYHKLHIKVSGEGSAHWQYLLFLVYVCVFSAECKTKS